MKRTVVVFALALMLAAAPAGPAGPAAAQTRVSVAAGFGIPRPYASGVVVVARPYAYYRAPAVIVLPARPRFFRRPRLVVVRWVYMARRHHRHHFDYDDD